MQKVAMHLSDRDIATLAAYLAAQPRPPGGACAGAAP